MACFRNFTPALWQIFSGNLLLLICSLSYLAWWIIAFRPDSSGRSAAGAVCISVAFITGIAAIALISFGINSLSFESKALPVKFILIGGAVLFLILIPVTTKLFHRTLTSELILIHAWTALELSAVIMLYGTGRFSAGRTALLSALIGIAFVIGLICYVLYYSLDKTMSYRVGMIPLAADALITAVFLAILPV